MPFRYIKLQAKSNIDYVNVVTLNLFDATDNLINNVAGQTATGSSYYASGYVFINMWDNNPATYWYTNSQPGSNHYNTLDLLTSCADVKKYTIQSLNTNNALTGWTIWGSNDKITWYIIDSRYYTDVWTTAQTYNVTNPPELLTGKLIVGGFQYSKAQTGPMIHTFNNPTGKSLYNFVDGGTDKLSGYVTIDGVPCRREVFLFEYESKRVIDSTWSRESDGYYEFSKLRSDHQYQVLSDDFKSVYHTVASDKVRAD